MLTTTLDSIISEGYAVMKDVNGLCYLLGSFFNKVKTMTFETAARIFIFNINRA